MPIPFAGCWLWLMSVASHGYGNATARVTGDPLAHRSSFIAFKGPIPIGMLVQHSCDMHWCVNPDHLSLGTDKTNADDKRRKGRGAHKLTDEVIRSIRSAHAGGETQRAIAGGFGVSQRMVLNIVNRASWKHVE